MTTPMDLPDYRFHRTLSCANVSREFLMNSEIPAAYGSYTTNNLMSSLAETSTLTGAKSPSQSVTDLFFTFFLVRRQPGRLKCIGFSL